MIIPSASAAYGSVYVNAGLLIYYGTANGSPAYKPNNETDPSVFVK